MDKYSALDHFEKCLSSLTSKLFTVFSERFIHKHYNLNYEEVKIIDREIEKIISKEEYERNENI